ncbi:MAG: hypothetical protein K0Q63_2637 [Paenibacillus sp.]|nr:hypothetical protein [Paenibacillus sp.]
MEVEVINLSSVVIGNGQWERRDIPFEGAKLMLVTQYGDRLWYIDVDGVEDSELMEWLTSSEDIRIAFDAVTESGQRLAGTAYAHPNMAHRALAIRGEGELRHL